MEKWGQPNIGSLMGISDISYKLSRKHSIRFEAQALMTGNFLMKDAVGEFQAFQFDNELDQGNWLTGIIEYTYSPHWFVAVQKPA